jgi:hypothetical protein
MAKFLETQAISSELLRLIKDAKEKIILVSPYLKVNSQIQERLKKKGRMGTLSEIVIVYGKSELKQTELDWIKDIPDLKLYEKANLHAKCYLNEERAIICSMNLYDYSQQNNIEMGLLISKEFDKEAYTELIEEINNIKVNGDRKQLDSMGTENKPAPQKISIDNNIKEPAPLAVTKIVKPIELSLEQKVKFQLLKKWRLYKSKDEQVSAFHVLTDEEIKTIVTQPKLDKNSFFDILPKKKAIKYSDQIIDELERSNKFTIGQVTSVWYQDDIGKYDRIKLKLIKTGEEKWFDTTLELPAKNKIVAAKLNNTWFNEYFYIDD